MVHMVVCGTKTSMVSNCYPTTRHYCKTWFMSAQECQTIHFTHSNSTSKASNFNMVKNYWYPDNLPYLRRGNHMYPSRPLTSLACPCCPLVHYVCEMCGDPTTKEVSRKLYGVTRSNTYGHVAVEKGNLTMHGLDSSW